MAQSQVGGEGARAIQWKTQGKRPFIKTGNVEVS